MTMRNASRFSTAALIAAITLLAGKAAFAHGHGFGGFGGGYGGGRIMNQLYRGSSSGNSSSNRYSGQRYSSNKTNTTKKVQQFPQTQSSTRVTTSGTTIKNPTNTAKLNTGSVVNNNAVNNAQLNKLSKKAQVGNLNTRVGNLVKDNGIVAGGVTRPSFPVKSGDIKIDPSEIGSVNVGRIIDQIPSRGGAVVPGQVGNVGNVLQPIADRVVNPGQLSPIGGGLQPHPLPFPGQVLNPLPGTVNPFPGPIGPVNPPAFPQPPYCPPANPPICGTKPCHPNWNWVGVTLPVLVGGVGGGHCRPTVINNTTVIEQPVVRVPVAAAEPTVPEAAIPDLQLVGVALFEQGSVVTATGPTYRVVIRNDSSVDVDSPFTVTVVAAKADRSFDGTTPRTDEPVISLAAGQEKTLDIRLPVESLTCEQNEQGNEAPFATLLVVIDGYAKLTESSRENNAAAIARNEVEAILPIVASAETLVDAGNRQLNVAGQSFGAEQGRVLLDLGAVRVPAAVVSWDSSAIRATLPAIETAANVITRLVIVRADGTSAEPFDLSQTEVAAK